MSQGGALNLGTGKPIDFIEGDIGGPLGPDGASIFYIVGDTTCQTFLKF